jgi:hypothetical protein
MDHPMPDTMHEHPYRRLALMALLSFLSMYGLMYMMVDRIPNVLLNVNQFYMAAMMTAPMVIFEVLLMDAMYPNKRANTAVMVASAVVLMLCIVWIRTQAFVGDAQLIKSMIPHHAGAILMCEEADLQGAEIQELCKSITASQQAEIDWMQAQLEQR